MSLPGWPTLCRSKGWAALLLPSRLISTPMIHSQNSFAAIIVTPTAPRPIPGIYHQLRPDRVVVHVLKFLHHLRAVVHVEVVVSSLPESTKLSRGFCEGECPLPRLLALSFPQIAGNSLLEHLHDFRGIAGSRFADQQVHMFGHEHIADQRKTIPGANLLQNSDGKIPCPNGAKKRPSLIATKSDEMEVAATSEASQMFRHRKEELPTLLNGKG